MGELRYLRKVESTTKMIGYDPDYKIGYEPWGPSPLDNIAPPTKKGEVFAWFAIGILATVVVLIVVLAIAAVIL